MVFPVISTVINKFVPDANVRLEVEKELFDTMKVALSAKTEILMAELKGDSWLQRNWRAACGWSLCGILTFAFLSDYVLKPYMWFFFGLDLPDIPIGTDLVNIVVFCLGGYIATLDSVERIVRWMKL